jgi:hypothetical protein
MNITVPASMVTNDHVYRKRKNGCSNINRPKLINTQAAISMGPRRSHWGQLLYFSEAEALTRVLWDVDMRGLSGALFAHCAKGDAA